jgi:hypothetical protein
MAIVAAFAALLFGYLGSRQADRGVARVLYLIALGAVAFAAYLVVFEPRLAWDMQWLARLFTRLVGQGLRELL